MADSFNCPKCGAPVKYDSAEQGDSKTIPCPYCGESILIPVELRRRPPAAQPNPINPQDRELLQELLQQEEASTTNTDWSKVAADSKRKRSIGNYIGYAGVIIGLTPIVIMIVYFVISQFNNSSSSPKNTAALATQTALFSVQSTWPVVIHDGFTGNKLNWTTGTDNNAMALEQKDIFGGKYSWEFVSKQSVGSFSFPDMPIQKDVFVSVDMQLTATKKGPDEKAGIVFHNSQTDKSFYFFAVATDGTFSLTMYDGSAWHDLISPTTSAVIKPNQDNHLAVSMKGNQILLQINNQIVGISQDDSLPSGEAGLGINLPDAGIDAALTFKNFYVRAP